MVPCSGRSRQAWWWPGVARGLRQWGCEGPGANAQSAFMKHEETVRTHSRYKQLAASPSHATDAHTSTPRALRLQVAACGRETPWYLLDCPFAIDHCILKSVPPPLPDPQHQGVSLQSGSWCLFIYLPLCLHFPETCQHRWSNTTLQDFTRTHRWAHSTYTTLGIPYYKPPTGV